MQSWLAQVSRSVLRWLRFDLSPRLTGAPAVRREKTYSAADGCVYNYFYLGHRPCRGGVEYAFEASRDRRTSSRVSVVLSNAALAPWQSAHQRELTGTERYAVAKLALQATFDRGRALTEQKRIHVQPADAAAILGALGID